MYPDNNESWHIPNLVCPRAIFNGWDTVSSTYISGSVSMVARHMSQTFKCLLFSAERFCSPKTAIYNVHMNIGQRVSCICCYIGIVSSMRLVLHYDSEAHLNLPDQWTQIFLTCTLFYLFLLSDKFPIINDIIAPHAQSGSFQQNKKFSLALGCLRKSHLWWLHMPRAARYTSELWPSLISSFGKAIHHGALTVRRGAWLQLCVTG